MSHRLFFVFCFLTISATSQIFNWTLQSPPRGRHVNASQMFNDYTVCSVGGRPINDSILFIATSNTACTTWELIADFPSMPMLNDLHFANNGNKGFAVGQSSTIHVSYDNGVSWFPLALPQDMQGVDFNGTYFINQSNGFVVGGKNAPDSMFSIVRTLDGGYNWEVIKLENGNPLNDVYFPSDSVGFCVGDNGTIYKTTSQGNDWTKLLLPSAISTIDFTSLYFFDNNNGMIVGGKKDQDSLQTIIRTSDGGLSWQILKNEVGAKLLSIDFLDDNFGYVVGYHGVAYQTLDGGTNWLLVNLPNQSSSWTLNDVDLLSSGNGLISGNDGLLFISSTVDPLHVGLDDILLDNITVYPNPASNYFTIGFENEINKDINIRLFDIKGQNVSNVEFELKDKAIYFNVQNLKDGIYYLSILNQENQILSYPQRIVLIK